ncbi:Serine protease SPPA- chloroplastic [Striga hermonthica]|uniref:Serine protease SPPA- chloroplastic n=1 Tax=Striga hermonthica TaxID=68872 RepID=A0A9N7NLY5_STRHE|nr:Serine protease SPPA- chloroplastic [Striga hermonthica]
MKVQQLQQLQQQLPTSHSIARTHLQLQTTTCCWIKRPSSFSLTTPHSKTSLFRSRQILRARAFDSERDENKSVAEEKYPSARAFDTERDENKSVAEEKYPSGDFVYTEYDSLKKLSVKLKMLIAWPWERVKKGSVLIIKLRGEISDQLKSGFSSALSLPEICENFIKAAYDPRISGIYLHIDGLSCGWGKVEEIRRHILDFKKSGSKFIVGYVPVCSEKEYYIASALNEIYAPPDAYFQLYGLTVQASFLGGVLEKIGIEPQVERIGKYKSAGDQLTRKNISEENREMLTALLDNVYRNWIGTVSLAKGKEKEDVENFINEGVYQVERLKQEGWITDIKYDDEVLSLLKERLGIASDKNLPTVDYRRYCHVNKWTLGLTGNGGLIAIIRASGEISQVRGPLNISSSGIFAEQFIEKIRTVRESKLYKAAVLRIDSPGGDALASDLMWREIKLLGESIPVVASMADVAASGGYYMAMAADTIVAENLTITGSIGVVTGKFNLRRLYEKIGFNKEIISRGKYAELTAAEQRPFRADEAELFSKYAEYAYRSFRDKAASCRSMSVKEMEEVAQGRVWTGNDAASRGLVDAIGGLSRAVAIAKQKANLPLDEQVTLIEVSSPTSLLEILSGFGSSIDGVAKTVQMFAQMMSSSNGIVQARMDRNMLEQLGNGNGIILNLIRDFLSFL